MELAILYSDKNYTIVDKFYKETRNFGSVSFIHEEQERT
jgi:hypothetical protein